MLSSSDILSGRGTIAYCERGHTQTSRSPLALMRAWHRKGRPKLCQFPQLVRDPLSIRGGSITRFKAKKMKVHNRLLLTQNDLKHVHMICTSHFTSFGVIGNLREYGEARSMNRGGRLNCLGHQRRDAGLWRRSTETRVLVTCCIS